MSWIDRLNQTISEWVRWATLFMVLITFVIVILRYGFNLGWIGVQESVMYLHCMVFLLGAAYSLQKGEHVRVDIFYRSFSDRGRAWVDLFGTLFLLVPVNLFILSVSWKYVMDSWALFEVSPETGGLPLVFALKTLLLLFAGLMLLQGLSEIVRNLKVLRTMEKQHD